MKNCKDCQKGICNMHDNEDSMKPKVVEISVSKQGFSPMSGDKADIKRKVLGDIKSMALKAMKENIGLDADIEDEMDKAPSDKGFKKEPKEEVEDNEVEMLPEDFGDSKKERLNDLLKEMEELKDRIKQMME